MPQKIFILPTSKKEMMKSEEPEKGNKGYILMRSLLDYGMGLLYLAVGVFMFFPEKFGFEMEGFDKIFRNIFGVICVVYGLFRVYRGFRKDYFKA